MNMNNIATKLIISILVFVLTLGVLVTTTYAWVTKAMTNIISDISLTAEAGPEFDISLGGSKTFDELTWTKIITEENMKKAIGDNLEFESVTSSDGKTFYRSSSTFGLGDTLIMNNDKNYENVSFIKIPLYFKTENIAEPVASLYGVGIYLTDYKSNILYDDRGSTEGTFVTSKGVTSKVEMNYFDSDGTERLKGSIAGPYYASEAVRVSFVQVNNFSVNDDESFNEYGEAKVFDLSNNPQYGHVSSNENKTYGFISYYLSKTGIILNNIPNDVLDLVIGTNFSTYDEKGYVLDYSSRVVQLNKTIINEKVMYIAKCYLYLWVEGWDADCYDVILHDYIYAQFAFKMAYGPVLN